MSVRLHDFLVREIGAIDAFVDLLDGEAKAMSDGEFAQLPELAARKADLAEKITALEQQRESEQVALGHPAGRSGADAASAAGGKPLQQAWHKLLERAALAQNLNQRNGVMIHAHLDFTRQTISFLQASGQPLYGPDGSHQAGAAGGKSLACG
ncbi:MAG: flagella synthesis protein FlgN [Rhodoferax sp.]